MPLTRAEARLLRDELRSHKVSMPHHSHGYPTLPSHIACPHCGRVDEHIALGSNSSLGASQGYYWRARHCRCREAFTIGITQDGQLQVLRRLKTTQQVKRERYDEGQARRAAIAAAYEATETAAQRPSPEPDTEPAVGAPEGALAREPTPEAPSALTGQPEPENEPEPPELASSIELEPELNAVPPETLREWAQEDQDLATDTSDES